MIKISQLKKLIKNPWNIIKQFIINNILWIVQFSHSSTWEDVILDWIIKKNNGLYIDIWWFDPIYWNNTYLFYKKWWRWINIEPNKKRILKFIKKRPLDTNLQIAIWNNNTNLNFYVFDDNTISTCDDNTFERYQKAWYKLIDKYLVEVWTLEKLFDTYIKNNQTIDIISIDAEWWDIEVLESNNWEKYKPNYIILETVEYAKNWAWTWIKQNYIFDPYMNSKWYTVIAETWINTIYKLQ